MSQTKESALERIKANQSDEPQLPATFQGLNANGMMEVFDGYRDLISKAVGTPQNVDNFIAVSTQLIARTPALQECTAPSIIGSIMRASVLDLSLSPEIGQCYLIPRFNKHLKAKECTFLIGYPGYIKLAYNTGWVRGLSANIVRKGDFFHYQYGLTEDLKHIPAEDDSGELTHAYCIWRLRDGGHIFKVYNRNQIMKARKKSTTSKEFSLWEDPDTIPDMWVKTAIRHSRKYVPAATKAMQDFAQNTAVDDEVINARDFNRGLSPDILEQKVEVPQPKPEPEQESEILRDTMTDPKDEPSKGDENAQPAEGDLK